jgi:hypothetical protein
VRTFPKELAEFRRVVEARGAALRQLSREELLAAGNQPIEDLHVQRRPATIAVIIESQSDGSLLVVVQGFMPGRWLGIWTNVALDGFYKRPDGKVDPASESELYKFD